MQQFCSSQGTVVTFSGAVNRFIITYMKFI